MSEQIKQILIVAILLLLMTILLFKTNSVDSTEHLRYSRDLRNLKEQESDVEKHLLELRIGALDSVQKLKTANVKIESLIHDLRSMPTFLDTNSESALKHLLDNYEGTNQEKAASVYRFIENNSKLTNALSDFKKISSEFDRDSNNEIETLIYAGQIRDFEETISEYYRSQGSELIEELENSVVSLKHSRTITSSPEITKKIDAVLLASQIILESKPERDRLVKHVISIKASEQIKEIVEFYQSKHFESVNMANVYRLVLYGFAIFLLIYGLCVFWKLKKISDALNLVNENLEASVDARTYELSLSNIELQGSETKNQALIGALPDIMWRINGAGVFLDVISADDNDIHVTNAGWEGKTIFEVLPEESANLALSYASKALETGERQMFEFESKKANKVCYYECRMVVCGSFEVLIIVRDITDLKHAQAESLLITEIIKGAAMTSTLEELLETVHCSINNLIYAENCFVALYDEMNDSLELPFFVDKYDPRPDGLGLGKGLTAYVVRRGKPAKLTKLMIESLISSNEIELVGTPPAVWIGIPLKTTDGVMGALVVQHYEDENAYMQRDVQLLESVGEQIAQTISRKRSEDALRVSEVRFQNAFDYAPIGICLASPDGRFQQVNRALCDILGYSKEELTDIGFIELTESGDRPNFLEHKAKILAGEISSFQVEQRYLHKSGASVLATTSISLVRDFTGAAVYLIAQIQDVSEQKNLADQLQRAQKLESIGQLAAGIAHEINTPTQYVGDNTRFLSDSFEGFFTVLEKNKELIEACKLGPVSEELIDEVEKAFEDADIEYLSEEIPLAITQALHGVERISKIVQSMKEFAHPGSHDKKAADLNKAIESTITVASNEWKYVANLETNFDENLPALPCLVGEFNQVILNMIINASHAISDVVGDGSNGKGTITISTTKAGEWAEIRIGDTGSGMPEDVRKKIFDPFFTTKEVGRGSGQGLAISHNVIVEKHSGTIEVESEVGKGTTFVIKLPMNDLSMPA